MLLRLSQTGDVQLLLIVAIAFVVAITIHEASHALAATWLGDDLPRLQGRLTLNPLRHLDPLGTVMIAIAAFGWGRPVLVNPYRLRYGVNRGMALVAAAGPASNVALAIMLTPLARQLIESATGETDFLIRAVLLIIQLNVLLALFNLLPIPPLDGFSVLVGVVPQETAEQLPQETAERLNELRRFGPISLLIVFLVIAVVPGASVIVTGPAGWVVERLLGI